MTVLLNVTIGGVTRASLLPGGGALHKVRAGCREKRTPVMDAKIHDTEAP
jgi:hypothetical protein